MISPAAWQLYRVRRSPDAGGVGERIFLYQDTQMHCPDSASQVSFRACSSSFSAYRLRGDDVPSGRRWPCCHTLLSGVTFKIQHHGQIVIFLYQLPAATRSMWRCFSSSLRTPPAARRPCASRQRRFRRPAPAHFFLLCPFNGRDGLIHQAGVLKVAALAFSSCASAGCRYSGMVFQTFSGSSSLQVKKIVTYTGHNTTHCRCASPDTGDSSSDRKPGKGRRKNRLTVCFFIFYCHLCSL